MESKSELFICVCGDVEHQFIISHDTEDKEIYISVHLTNYMSFFQRIITAIKYIFGKKSIYGAFDVVILNKNQIIELRNSLNQKIKDFNIE
jgi:hypothetical protein